MFCCCCVLRVVSLNWTSLPTHTILSTTLTHSLTRGKCSPQFAPISAPIWRTYYSAAAIARIIICWQVAAAAAAVTLLEPPHIFPAIRWIRAQQQFLYFKCNAPKRVRRRRRPIHNVSPPSSTLPPPTADDTANQPLAVCCCCCWLTGLPGRGCFYVVCVNAWLVRARARK